jgi:P-type Ca2+ transporter type 2C
MAGYPIINHGAFIPPTIEPVGNVYILATTVFHVGVVMAQIGNAFACRSERVSNNHLGWTSNRNLLLGISAALVLIILTVYINPLAKLFNHLALPPIDWLGLLIFAPVLYSLEQGRKFLVRRVKMR